MCKASHEPGGPRRCSGDVRQQLAQASAEAAEAVARDEAFTAGTTSTGAPPAGLLVHCIQIGHESGAHPLTEHCLRPCEIGRSYTDVAGRTQYAVDGPAGTFLITRNGHRDPWQVWRSDSLGTAARDHQLRRAVSRAVQLSGRGPATPVPTPAPAADPSDNPAALGRPLVNKTEIAKLLRERGVPAREAIHGAVTLGGAGINAETVAAVFDGRDTERRPEVEQLLDQAYRRAEQRRVEQLATGVPASTTADPVPQRVDEHPAEPAPPARPPVNKVEIANLLRGRGAPPREAIYGSVALGGAGISAETLADVFAGRDTEHLDEVEQLLGQAYSRAAMRRAEYGISQPSWSVVQSGD